MAVEVSATITRNVVSVIARGGSTPRVGVVGPKRQREKSLSSVRSERAAGFQAGGFRCCGDRVDRREECRQVVLP
jgi:hypothetical protein